MEIIPLYGKKRRRPLAESDMRRIGQNEAVDSPELPERWSDRSENLHAVL
jgi:hypothetical protein